MPVAANLAPKSTRAKQKPSRSAGLDDGRMSISGKIDSAAASASPWFIQAKLSVGALDDPLEREADRIAERVTHMRVADDRSDGNVVRRACCSSCAQEEGAQRKPASTERSDTQCAPDSVGQVLGAPGRPLSAEHRVFFEPRFGANFGDVRVHDDTPAFRSANAIGARAYTLGTHIVLGGADATSTAGRALMAHELVHVMQQRGARGALVRRQTNGDGQSPGGGGGGGATGSGTDLATQLSASKTITCDFGQGRVFCTFQDIDNAMQVDDCEQVAIRTYDACIKTDTNRNCLARVRCAVCQCVGPKLCSCTGMI